MLFNWKFTMVTELVSFMKAEKIGPGERTLLILFQQNALEKFVGSSVNHPMSVYTLDLNGK